MLQSDWLPSAITVQCLGVVYQMVMLSHFSQVSEKHLETFLRRRKEVEKLITVHSCK